MKMQLLLKICLINIFTVTCFRCGIAAHLSSIENHPIVYTIHGPVRGTTHALLNSTVHVFWSIPFAEPPIGQLRFQRPVPKPIPAWSGILDGTRRPNACYQLDIESWTLNVPESEDCLYLNVYMPNTAMSHIDGAHENASDINATNYHLLPVMFYIYGGTYLTGASSIERYNSSALAILNDVIVVTSNYRLGPFGYLYSGSDDAPGNAGLYDQLTALRWVHDNIHSFGGDPNDVTVFGNSAGSLSTGHMIMSNLTHGLFHKAIMMSGTPNRIIKLHTLETYSPYIMGLANATNCTHGISITNVTACLKLLSAVELRTAHQEGRHMLLLHGPVQDVEFFGDLNSETDMYEEIARKNLTILMGLMENEGGNFVTHWHYRNNSLSNKELHRAIDYGLLMTFIGNLTVHQNIMIHYLYTNWNDVNDGKANIQILARFLGDSLFVCPANEFADRLSNRGMKIYYYVFNERPSISRLPSWLGAAHADELYFAFGHPLDSSKGFTDEEAESSYRFIKILGNFAKYGIPSYEEIDWPQYTSEHRLYVELKSKGEYRISKNPRAMQCAVWNDVLQKLAEPNCTSSRL